MSVIVRTDVTFQEGVSHTGQDMQRQGRAVIRLEEVADPARLDVGSQTNLVEILCCRAVLDRKPGSGLPLVSRCHWRVGYCRGIDQRLNNYASPQAAQGRIIFAHVRLSALPSPVRNERRPEKYSDRR